METVKTERAETPAPNSTFAIGGVSCSADSFVVAESLCSASTFVVKSPPIANLQNVTTHFPMTRDWNDIKWFFEPDGSLRDIYVQNVTILDWQNLLDFLNLNYIIKFGEDDEDKIDINFAIKFLQDSTGKMEGKTLRIDLNGINIHCHFFLDDQIEFDIDPREIKSLKDFEQIEMFMVSISQILNTQVTLTEENSPLFPLFKVDVGKNINRFLTKKEANELSSNRNGFYTKLVLMKTRFKMRFFPRLFQNQIIKSGSSEYKATDRQRNEW